MKVALVREINDECEELWKVALRDLESKRGGPELLASLSPDVGDETLLTHASRTSSLWAGFEKDHLVGLGVVRSRVVVALYVAPKYRRQQVATSILRAMLASDLPPLDGYALPGDRATKSLYESLGWKARLLTMRGA